MQRLQVIGTITFLGILFLTAVYVEGLGAPGYSGSPRRETQVLSLRVFLPPETTTGEPGSPCRATDDLTSEHPGSAHPQLLVTNDAQRIVTAVDLTAGTYQRQGDRVSCRLDMKIGIQDSPFYTFTIEGTYRKTMARETLDEADWSITIGDA